MEVIQKTDCPPIATRLPKAFGSIAVKSANCKVPELLVLKLGVVEVILMTLLIKAFCWCSSNSSTPTLPEPSYNLIHQPSHSVARQTLGSKISHIGTWCHCYYWYHLPFHLLLKPQDLHWKMPYSSNSSSHQYLPGCRIVNQKLNRDSLLEDKLQAPLHVDGITASAHSSIYLSLCAAQCNETLRPRGWIQKYPIYHQTSTWSWLPRPMVPRPVWVTIGHELHPLIILELLQVEKRQTQTFEAGSTPDASRSPIHAK